MKKFLVISSVIAVFAAASASAKDGVYAGLDLNTSHTVYKNEDKTSGASGDNHSKTDSDAVGAGVNLGYKQGVGSQFFLAPEVFFDYLNNSGDEPSYASDAGSRRNDRVEFNSRIGVKVNFGYEINSKLAAFVSAGAARTFYEVNTPTLNLSNGSSDISGIYGFGLAYDINDRLTIKTSVDRQRINADTPYEGLSYNARIGTARIGVAYNF